ncbi:hypothetical protein GF361_02525 [Candidatus Woesearchaeota archaeon]|nr:hypothetical protein [Candidatus Woesearchaeota archaeon]
MGIKPANYFILKDGTVIKNLFELSKQLDKMPEEVFSHHVNENRNDFYNWVKDVVKDKSLARKISSVKDKSKMKKYIGAKIQKDVVKGMNHKKPKTKPRTKTAEKKNTQNTKTKPAKTQEQKKSSNSKNIIKDIWITLFKQKKEDNTKNHPYINQNKVKPGINCPYKTIHCGLLEFLFGIVIGLLIAMVLNQII